MGPVDGADGQFDDGMGGEAGGESPGPDVAANLSDDVFAVDVDEVDGELHEECVDGLARYDPEAPALR